MKKLQLGRNEPFWSAPHVDVNANTHTLTHTNTHTHKELWLCIRTLHTFASFDFPLAMAVAN